ncbi:MAG: hypothetical protein NVSMB26_04610 [Beijerinckiaceae bacterium]
MRGAILFCLFLAGCGASREQIEYARQDAIDRAVNEDDKLCQSYGAAKGSEQYVRCRMQRDSERQANDRAIAAAIIMQPRPRI